VLPALVLKMSHEGMPVAWTGRRLDWESLPRWIEPSKRTKKALLDYCGQHAGADQTRRLQLAST
jgi:hypothetical protein